MIMNNIKYFQNTVKKHRKLLTSKGFPASTLTMYIQGKRFPSIANARRIARLTRTNVENYPILIRNK